MAGVEGEPAARRRELIAQLSSLVNGEPNMVANLANLAAALAEALPAASWVGFYIRRGEQLVLGPFQGKVACVRIDLGRGVCGTAATERRTLVVPDVASFPGTSPAIRRRAARSWCRSSRTGVVAVIDVNSRELAALARPARPCSKGSPVWRPGWTGPRPRKTVVAVDAVLAQAALAAAGVGAGFLDAVAGGGSLLTLPPSCSSGCADLASTDRL